MELENARHESFVQGLFSGLSQRKAYRQAFKQSKKWKDETVDNKASKLAKNSEILARLKELQKKVASDNIMSEIELQEFWSETIKDIGAEMKDRLKASELLGKKKKMFIQQLESKNQHEHKVLIEGEVEEWAN